MYHRIVDVLFGLMILAMGLGALLPYTTYDIGQWAVVVDWATGLTLTTWGLVGLSNIISQWWNNTFMLRSTHKKEIKELRRKHIEEIQA